MISNKMELDGRMVRRVIHKNGFDPVPNFSQTVLWDEVELTVEGYSWGRVFFARSLGLAVGMTWLEIPGRRPPLLPSWLKEARGRVDRPECLGWHDRVVTCDGGHNEDGEWERPCVWRDRCYAVRKSLGNQHHVDAVQRLLHDRDDHDLDLMAGEHRVHKAPSSPPMDTLPGEIDGDTAREILNDLLVEIMDQGGWTLAPSRFRTSAGQWFRTEYPRDESILYYSDPRTGRLVSAVSLIPMRSRPYVTMGIRTLNVELVKSRLPEGNVTLGSVGGRKIVRAKVRRHEIGAAASAVVTIIRQDDVSVRGVEVGKRPGQSRRSCYNAFAMSPRRS